MARIRSQLNKVTLDTWYLSNLMNTPFISHYNHQSWEGERKGGGRQRKRQRKRVERVERDRETGATTPD